MDVVHACGNLDSGPAQVTGSEDAGRREGHSHEEQRLTISVRSAH